MQAFYQAHRQVNGWGSVNPSFQPVPQTRSCPTCHQPFGSLFGAIKHRCVLTNEVHPLEVTPEIVLPRGSVEHDESVDIAEQILPAVDLQKSLTKVSKTKSPCPYCGGSYIGIKKHLEHCRHKPGNQTVGQNPVTWPTRGLVYIDKQETSNASSQRPVVRSGLSSGGVSRGRKKGPVSVPEVHEPAPEDSSGSESEGQVQSGGQDVAGAEGEVNEVTEPDFDPSDLSLDYIKRPY